MSCGHKCDFFIVTFSNQIKENQSKVDHRLFALTHWDKAYLAKIFPEFMLNLWYDEWLEIHSRRLSNT